MPVARINGTDLFYTQVGRGAPCLVMHGGLGVDHTQFREWIDPLGDVFRLTYYDHRGNGRSGRPPIETLTFEQLSADADGLRAHLGIETVAVMGHSYGGCLALLYALQYPQRVSRLLLVGTTAVWDYFDAMAAELARRAVTPAVVRALVDLPKSDEEMAHNQYAIAPLALHRDHVYLVNRVLGKTIWNAAANVRSRDLATAFNVASRLGEIAAPTFILTGRHDFFCPPGQAERLHRGIRGSALVIFERSGHYPFAEESAAFQNAVRVWLMGHAGQRRVARGARS
jgi:proline iminopeptidase